MVDWFRLAVSQLSVDAIIDRSIRPTHWSNVFTSNNQSLYVDPVTASNQTRSIVGVDDQAHAHAQVMVDVSEPVSEREVVGYGLFTSPYSAPKLERIERNSTAKGIPSITRVQNLTSSATSLNSQSVLQFLVRLQTISGVIYMEFQWWRGQLSMTSSLIKGQRFTGTYYLTNAGYYSIYHRQTELVVRLGDRKLFRISNPQQQYSLVSADSDGVLIKLTDSTIGVFPSDPVNVMSYKTDDLTFYDRQFIIRRVARSNGGMIVVVVNVRTAQVVLTLNEPNSIDTSRWYHQQMYYDDVHRALIIVTLESVLAYDRQVLRVLYQVPDGYYLEDSTWLNHRTTLLLKLADESDHYLPLRITYTDNDNS